jgi:DNA-binding transcriptional MerR regulator
MSSETYFNASQAAKHAGVNVVTIRDYLVKGRLPNARQTPKGKVKVWAIPLTDLVAAGLLDKVSSDSEAQIKEVRSTALQSQISELQARLTLTEQLLAEVRADRDYLRTRVPAQLETRDTQEQRRSWWFGRNK